VTGAAVTELRDLGSMILVNGRPATADEATAWRTFIRETESPAHLPDGGGHPPDWRTLLAAFGNPPGGLLVKTPEATDILN
jgi:hypothetical protein